MEIGLEIDVDNIELLNEEKEKEIHVSKFLFFFILSLKEKNR